jgi:hypothetical protein
MLSLFLLKVSRLSTRKRDLKTNLKDALIAEEQENSREVTLTTETKAMATGGKGERG